MDTRTFCLSKSCFRQQGCSGKLHVFFLGKPFIRDKNIIHGQKVQNIITTFVLSAKTVFVSGERVQDIAFWKSELLNEINSIESESGNLEVHSEE